MMDDFLSRGNYVLVFTLGNWIPMILKMTRKFFSKLKIQNFEEYFVSWMKNVELNMVDFLGQYHKDQSWIDFLQFNCLWNLIWWISLCSITKIEVELIPQFNCLWNLMKRETYLILFSDDIVLVVNCGDDELFQDVWLTKQWCKTIRRRHFLKTGF